MEDPSMLNETEGHPMEDDVEFKSRYLNYKRWWIAPHVSEWNLTEVPPPPNYKQGMMSPALRDYVNLRVPKKELGQETAADRNLKAWREAHWRPPFGSDRRLGEPTRLRFRKIIMEFVKGYFFGSIFAVIWRGPSMYRTIRNVWRRRYILPYAPYRERWRLFRRFIRANHHVPMLFATFQVALRGFDELVPGYTTPLALGVVLVSLNHRFNRKTRMSKLDYYSTRFRGISPTSVLEYESLSMGDWRDKMWIRYQTGKGRFRRFRKRLVRGMILIGLFEMMLHQLHTHDSWVSRLFSGSVIMASPTYGADPVEKKSPVPFKWPEVQPPTLDGSNAATAALWANNQPGSGLPYIHDQRMFLVPSMRPVLEPTREERLRYDDTAVAAMNDSPAFYLGQRDWNNPNLSTHAFPPVISFGAIDDGRYMVQKEDVEERVQQLLETDPTWVDPALRDIADELLDKSTADEYMMSDLVKGLKVRDSWQEEPHKALIMRDEKRWEEEADRHIVARSFSFANLSHGRLVEKWYNALFHPEIRYNIPDGPGGYMNISHEYMQARRHYAMSVDPKPIPDQLKPTPGHRNILAQLRWAHERQGLPPGMPEGMPSHLYKPML